MSRRVRALLSHEQNVALTSIVAESPQQMKWLSTLYQTPGVKILQEDRKNLATHVLIIVKYSFPKEIQATIDSLEQQYLVESDTKEEGSNVKRLPIS